MEKEEKIIHTTLLETKLADERLSAYATKNSECIKVKKTIQPSMDFDIRWPFEYYIQKVIHDMLIKLKHYPFLVMCILLKDHYMYNGFQELLDK